MQAYTVTISDSQDKALAVVAEKEGTTKNAIVQNQINYYVGCVLRDYATDFTGLKEDDISALNTIYANEKAKYVAAKEASVEQSIK